MPDTNSTHSAIHHRNYTPAPTEPPPVTEEKKQGETHILVVDDEAPLRNLLRISLQKNGYLVHTAANGREALDIFQEIPIDLVLMDILMPTMDGHTLCAELRKRSDVPIIMLSALNRSDDIVEGITLGADDYIAKPFQFREVAVRIEAILRRVAWLKERRDFNIIACNDILLDSDLHEVQVRGELVHLTPTEFSLLRHLMNKPDRPVSKEDLFMEVWGYTEADDTNLVEVAIRRLREKIEEEPSKPNYLLTVRGIGYKFNTQHNTTVARAPKRVPA